MRGIPVDPAGEPFEIDPVTGDVSVSARSGCHPCPHSPGSQMTPDTIVTIAFAIFGLCIGSFLNVVIHRLPRGADGHAAIPMPRLQLPAAMVRQRAGPQLGLPEGRCRKCKAPISIRYPIVEILTMLFLLHLAVRVVSADDRASGLCHRVGCALRDRSRTSPAAESRCPGSSSG